MLASLSLAISSLSTSDAYSYSNYGGNSPRSQLAGARFPAGPESDVSDDDSVGLKTPENTSPLFYPQSAAAPHKALEEDIFDLDLEEDFTTLEPAQLYTLPLRPRHPFKAIKSTAPITVLTPAPFQPRSKEQRSHHITVLLEQELKSSARDSDDQELNVDDEEDDEQETRGRSRFPRLLWRSQLEDESAEVIGRYYTVAMGGQGFPLYKPNKRACGRSISRSRVKTSLKEWSDKLDEAGL